MLTQGHVIRRQDPPVTMTIALPRRLHDVFVEGAKAASMPLGMYVVQMIEAAWTERCGKGEVVTLPQLYELDREAGTIRPINEPVDAASLQARVQPWLLACFGEMIAADRVERNHRFLEEALELVQSLGCTASEATQLVDYVYGREVGEPKQEVGGVMITLAALCLASGIDMHECGEIELARIWPLIEKIRAKQASKPKNSPLPETAPARKKQAKKFAATPKPRPIEHAPHLVGAVQTMREAVMQIMVNPPAPAQAAPAPRKLAPAEVLLIKGLLAAGMKPREITKEYAYTAAQIATARGQS